MKPISITSKRQATLPVEVCEELGVGAGDSLELERRTLEGETVWLLRAKKPDWSWLGAARRYAKGRRHRWSDVEASIARGFADDDRS